MLIIGSAILLLIYLKFVDKVLPQLEPVRTFLESIGGVEFHFWTVVKMHVVECTLVFAIGIYSGFPFDVILKYVLSTSFFGIGGLIECVKTALKVKRAKRNAD
jgi:hypothetical protein